MAPPPPVAGVIALLIFISMQYHVLVVLEPFAFVDDTTSPFAAKRKIQRGRQPRDAPSK